MIFSKILFDDFTSIKQPLRVDFMPIAFYKCKINLNKARRLIRSRKVASIIARFDFSLKTNLSMLGCSLIKYLTDPADLMQLVKKQHNLFDSVPPHMITRRIAAYCVGLNGYLLQYVPAYLMTYDMVKSVVASNHNASDVNSEFWTDETISSSLNRNSLNRIVHDIQYIPEDKITVELAAIAVNKSPKTFEFLPERIQTSEFVRDNIKALARQMRVVPKHLITQEIADLAVDFTSVNIAHIPENMITPELALKAIRRKPENIKLIPAYKITFKLMSLALSRDAALSKYIPIHLQTPEMMKKLKQT